MRPVSAEFPVNQPFGSMATAGVAPSWTPDTVGWYVRLYGNYQPFGHAGCDIACPEGTPVHAIAAGTVLWADWGTNLPGDDSWGPSGYFRRWALYKGFPGIVTVIQHDGWIGVYAHLSAAWMNVGDTVTEAQQIGLSGGTGGVAAHLHVEALIDTTYSTGNGLIYGRTNPEPYFGSGAITAQGSTTTPLPLPLEDDMPTVNELLYAPIPKYDVDGNNIGTTSLAEVTAWNEANFYRQRKLTLDAIRETVLGVLTTELSNVATGGTTSLGTEASWAAWNAKRNNQGGVDTAAVADAISKAIAAKLTADTVTK